jgi:hypothetical protein
MKTNCQAGLSTQNHMNDYTSRYNIMDLTQPTKCIQHFITTMDIKVTPNEITPDVSLVTPVYVEESQDASDSDPEESDDDDTKIREEKSLRYALLNPKPHSEIVLNASTLTEDIIVKVLTPVLQESTEPNMILENLEMLASIFGLQHLSRINNTSDINQALRAAVYPRLRTVYKLTHRK